MDPKKIVALTNDPNDLNGIRKERMRAYGLPENSSYSDIEKIRRELALANVLYQQLGCNVIDVASLSLEETALSLL
ncbi:kinase/pyrophosphorylase, partial [Enterococcus faecalis]|uniref:kinase/pyrophosphorylase n=1 Tax=Enterococcus faecalis TaxID=1351 RepID=UPI003CC56455